MRRFVYFIIAIGLICSLTVCTVTVSAAEYELGTPKSLSYTVAINADVDTFPYASIYSYDPDDGSVDFYSFLTSTPSLELSYFSRYSGLGGGNMYWRLGSFNLYDSVARHIEVTGFDYSKPALAFGCTGDVRNKLFMRGIVWENLMLPLNGQYLRVDLSFDSALIQAPSEILSVFSLENICYLCDTSGRPGFTDRYSLPKVQPSTATVSKSGNIYSYSFFFNLHESNLSSLAESDNICLAVRIPYYFNSAASFEGGVHVVSNADLPLTYEILNVGGYEQALENIENAIVSSNEELIDLYTNQTNEDKTHILELNSKNDIIDNAVGGYNDAHVKIDNIVTNAVIPPVADLITEPIMQDLNMPELNKNYLFWNDLVLGMVSVTLTFGIISLILYGKKG